MDKRVAQTVAIGVLLLAVLLAVVDTGSSDVAAIDAATESRPWASAVEAGADHVTPEALADLLLETPDRLLVVDVRLPDEFAHFHLPGSVNLNVVELLGPHGAALFDANLGKAVVLVSNGMTHPAQAWVALTEAGRTNVRILEDGLDGFVARVLTPPSLRGATTEARARSEAGRFEALRARILLGRPATARHATDPDRLSAPTVVSTAWVAARLESSSLVILDTRPKLEAFKAGHLAGAIWAPVGTMREVREGVADELRPSDRLAQVVGGWGIGPDTEVVVYGGDRLQDATHAFLGFVSLGHEKVALMEGGLPAWVAEGRALTTALPDPTRVDYAPHANAFDFGVSLDEVVAASEASGAPPILDVRPTKSFEGARGKEIRGGRIPGSISRPYTEDVVQDSRGVYWRSTADLRKAYEGLGLTPEAPVIVSCRTGHQASQAWFVLRYLLGYQHVRWFDGSWKAWSLRPELPADQGPVKGVR